MTEAVLTNSSTRRDFVEMLFALTIAEIAVKGAEVVSAGPHSWDYAAAFAHLLLATVLVSSSWVGWSHSSAPGNRADATDVLSLPFVVLLLDVLLVVFYFILVRGAEGPSTSSGTALEAASAAWETKWVAWIFSGYLAWDVLTKLLMGSEARVVRCKEFCRRGGITALCLAIALGLHACLAAVSGAMSVIAADLSLIALVLLFRSLKGRLDGKYRLWWPLVCGALVVLLGSVSKYLAP